MINPFKKILSSKVTTSAEEITERSTTKMGYFLLVCMWIALFSLGQWSLTIIRDIPVPPQSVPTCIYDIISVLDVKSSSANYNTTFSCYPNYPNGGRQFVTSDNTRPSLYSNKPVFNLQNFYDTLLPTANKVENIFLERDPIQNQIYQLENNLSTEKERYKIGLQEKTANAEPIYNTPENISSVKESEATLKLLRAKLIPYDTEINTLRSETVATVQALQTQVNTIEIAYERAYRWWQLTIDLLDFLFVGLVFGVLYVLYSRFKKVNSPHAIIFTVATFAYGILFLQVVLVSIWDIIPHVFIEQLLNFLRNFSPVLYVLQFFIPLLLVGLFGWLVYRIQKRLFSRENILKRIVSDRRCPHCNNTIDIDKAFCPLCAYEIQMECPSCHKLTIKGMPFCSNCGEKIQSSI